MAEESLIKALIKKTTCVKIERKNGLQDETIYTSEDGTISRFQREQGKQIDINEVLRTFNSLFEKLEQKWDEKYQIYRWLYEYFLTFHKSFELLRFFKVKSIEDRAFRGQYEIWTELSAMYYSGNKCLQLIEDKLNLIPEQDKSSAHKIKGARNLFIEHNETPNGIKDYIFEPSIFSLQSSDSFLQIDIHNIASRTELTHIAYIDYYEDYFQTEKIILDALYSVMKKNSPR